MKAIKTAREILKKYVFPEGLYCISCGAIIDGSRTYHLCDECMAGFSWITGEACSLCGKSMGHADARRNISLAAANLGNPGRGPEAEILCHDCMVHPHSFDRGFSCVSYGEKEKQPLMKLKYGGAGYLGETLGKIMYDRLIQALGEEGGEIPFDTVIPVPVHPKRLALRGYNQAALMGKSLAELLQLPFEAEALRRVKATEKMSGLGAEKRVENLEGAFEITKKGRALAGQKILLVDDIYTTGNTADAAAAVLKSAGIDRVYLATFASGSNFVPDVEMNGR